MNPKAIYKYCKHLGCCEACCLRFIGIKNPNAYENVAKFVIKYQEDKKSEPLSTAERNEISSKATEAKDNILDVRENKNQNVKGNSLENKEITIEVSSTSPPSKKRRLDVCVSCLGILQEDNWMESYILVKEVLFKKRYECKTFACALSAPIATLLREKAITLRLAEELPGYDANTLTALKEAWKWSFGVKLASVIDKTLDSGAVSPLLVTLNYDYADDLQELEILKQVSPQLFEERSKQKRRFVTEFTRRSVEQALEHASLRALRAAGGGLPAGGARAHCVAAHAAHAPHHLAGRYIKLSRNLPQSPWILDGKRVLPSSVQEIIFKPLADFYNVEAAEADRRLKLVAAGREDVDVRCLGEGRPFAVEITDPMRQLTPEELAKACEEICKSGEVIVKKIVPITKEDLIQLKKGEETKSKTYEALCIKLSHSKYENVSADSPIKVTPEDIARINSFRNTPVTTKHNTNLERIKTEHNKNDPESVTKISEDVENTANKFESSENDVEGDKSLENVAELKSTDSNKKILMDASNGDQIAKTPDDSDDDKEMETSSIADIPDFKVFSKNTIDKCNGAQKPEDNTASLKDIEDVLDTTEDITDTEIPDGPEDVKITIQQKTPIRVLHRRPLLTRTRQILELKAAAVPEHGQLFRIWVRTSAGTYVKEWAHGELGRSRPALGEALGARVDMLALDVTAVHLAWPPPTSPQ